MSICANYNDAKNRTTKYWGKKPVAPIGTKINGVREIQSESEIRANMKSLAPILPEGYEWMYTDVCDLEKMQSQCDFLNIYYRRGNESEFTVRLTPKRLEWEMMNRGWFISVIDESKNIVGTIGYTFKNVIMQNEQYTVCEPVYLCCDPKCHGSGLVKKLMDEVIRNSCRLGVTKGVCSDNRIFANPISTIRQYSRPLNYKKLRKCEFVEAEGVNDDEIHESLRILLNPNKKYIVANLTESNVDIVHKLFSEYMLTFSIHPVFTKEELASLLFNNEFVKTLLVHNDNGEIVDFISYNVYDLHKTGAKYEMLGSDEIIRASNILMYTANVTRVDLLFINVLKQISKDKIDIVYVNDMMTTTNVILSKVKKADEDTDEEDSQTVYDMQILKTGQKRFIIGYNFGCEPVRQDMIYWFLP